MSEKSWPLLRPDAAAKILLVASLIFCALCSSAQVSSAQPVSTESPEQIFFPTNWPATNAPDFSRFTETNAAPQPPAFQAPSPFLVLTNLGAAASASVTPASSGSPVSGVTPAFAGTSQLAAPPVALAPLTEGRGLAQWGPFQLHAFLGYYLSYGNGLQATPGNQANTLIQQVSPGILLNLGSHWSLDYTPTFNFYSSGEFKDTIDHSVSLNGSTTYRDWAFGLSQAYALTTQPLIETGGQTHEEVFSTFLSAAWQINSVVSLDFGLSQNFRFTDQPVGSEALSDTRSWSTSEWINYKIAPHLSVGLGVGAGYDNVSLGLDDVYVQLQGRITWQAGNKLSFYLSGGADYRTFLNSDSPNLLNPIYTLAAQYQLLETTALSLSGSSSVSPSYFGGAVSENSSIAGGVHQRLLRRLFLNVSAGYGTTDYTSTTPGLAGAPASGYGTTSVNVSLSTAFMRRGTASVFYSVNFVSSGSAIYDYTTTQVGLALAYGF